MSMPIEALIATGRATRVEYGYGSYRLRCDYFKDSDRAQVTMFDIAKRWPLLWSKPMTKKQAHGAHTLFEAIGYFDMPI